MSTIPLLNLPSFAQDIIVRNLDAAQVLGITLRSKFMHHVVSRSKYSRIPVTQLTALYASVEILTAEESLLCFRHGTDYFWEVKDVQCIKFRNGFYLTYGAHQEKFIIEHLLSIFNIDQFHVSVKTGKFEDLTIFEHVRKFSLVLLEGILLTASQLKFLLEDIETDSLAIRNMPDMLTEYPREFIFNHRKMSIELCPNMPFSSILSMKSESLYVELNATDSTIQDLVGFIKHWVSGGMEQFKSLHIMYGNWTDQIRNSVLEEINEMEDVHEGSTINRPDGKAMRVEIILSHVFMNRRR